jgi:hypothetical protein
MATATKVNYDAIYEFLGTFRGRVITPSALAYGIGVERIYGGTMSKLVRDGYLEPCAEKGFYRIIKRTE